MEEQLVEVRDPPAQQILVVGEVLDLLAAARAATVVLVDLV